MKQLVHVRGRAVEIDVHLKPGRKSVWIAKGEFHDTYYDVEGRTRAAATYAWVEAVKYHN